MKRNLFSILALAALGGQLAVWSAYAARPVQPNAGPPPPFALVKDISTGPQLRGSVFGSTLFGTLNNQLLFSAFNQQSGDELWRSDGTPGGTQLVKDILPGERGTFDFQNAQSLMLNNQLLFAPNDGAHGTELWATDGTRPGTRLIKDLFPGADSSNPRDFVASGNRAFFSAQVSGAQQALWISDGTPNGTTMLHAFAQLDSAPVLVGDTIFFSAGDVGSDVELWKSDGTPAGTVLVKDIAPDLAGSFPINLFAYSAGELWFSANDGVHGRELWRSDGTTDGTRRFREPAAGLPIANPSEFVMLHHADQADDSNKVVFNADGAHGQELWASDGTPAGTARVKDVNPTASAIPTFLGLGARQAGVEQALYSMDDGTNGTEPWVTDGTITGTVMLANIYPGHGSNPSRAVTIGKLSFFAATSATTGRELWKTDGTPAGTVLVADINADMPGSEPEDLTAFNGALYFSADDGVHGRELWKTDGAKTTLVRDIQPGSEWGMFRTLGVALGALYFSADDGTTGIELWKTDGTPAGTVLVQNIAPDTGGIFIFKDSNAGALGDKLLFGIDLAANGEALVNSPSAALWQSDGSAAGTTAIKPFLSDAPFAPLANMTALGAGMLFTASDSEGVTELWRTDGSAAGTAILTNTVKPHFGFVDNLSKLNNLVVFGVYTSTLAAESANVASLWKTDGTPQGTQPITTGLLYGNSGRAVSGSTLFFGGSPPDQSFAVELWKTDGTTAGTQQLSALSSPISGSEIEFITPGQPGQVFFVAHSELGYQLWKSDGTPAGTLFVHNLPVINGQPSFNELTYVDGRLFFSADDGVNGWELWQSDGTTAGTTIAADIYPGAGSSHPEHLIGLNGVLHFSATGPDGRRTLWNSDGSSDGTLPVRDDAGAPLNPEELTVANGRLFFSAADDTHGSELWRSDGTANGTLLLQDIVPGASNSNPQLFIAAGEQLYLTADTPESGRELWDLAAGQSPGQPTPTPQPGQPTPTSQPGQPTPTSQPGQSPEQPVYLPLLAR